jgi:trk system potassium uptake protein TrkH
VPLFRRFSIIRSDRPLPAWLVRYRLAVTSLVGLALLLLILRSGYLVPALVHATWLPRLMAIVTSLAAIIDIVLTFIHAPTFRDYLRARWFDLALILPIAVSVALGGTGLLFVAVRQSIVVAGAFTRSRRFASLVEGLRLQPVQLMALSFLGLIALGTLLLSFPVATANGRGTGFLDALFTATSAVCVTGLIVKDTAVFFSRFGQSVILALIQLGGLGIMTFSASLVAAFGRRLGLGQRSTVSTMIEQTRDIDILRTLRYILLLTVSAEIAGTLLLFLCWRADFPSAGAAIYSSAFHAVSAFCNAGFSLFSDSLVRYRGHVAVNLVIIGLIVAGGLGFGAVHELLNRQTFRRPLELLRRLTIHSRLVLGTTALLIIAGTVFFFFFEYDGSLAPLPVGTKLLAALFQAVTPRTAGFNTVPFNALKPVTLFALLGLMFVGASPGGTGGGIKTSTLAVLFLAVRSRIRGEDEIAFAGRAIPRDVVYRATAIAAVAGAIVAGFFGLLLITERAAFADILFETVSAFGTVGLSTGLTPALSPVGKLAVTVLMYAGRLGPLTLALAMSGRRTALPIRYPDARIMVG